MSTVVKVARENHIAFDELKLDLFEDYKSMLETKMEDYKNSGKKHLFKVFVKWYLENDRIVLELCD